MGKQTPVIKRFILSELRLVIKYHFILRVSFNKVLCPNWDEACLIGR